LRGCGMAFAFMPLQTATYANIEAPDTGRASSINSTQRQTSAALGVAILATIFITRTNHLLDGGAAPDAAKLGGFHAGFIAAVAIFYLGSVFAFFKIKDSDAARTMQPRTKPATV